MLNLIAKDLQLYKYSRLRESHFWGTLYNCQRGRPALDEYLALLATRLVYFLILLLYSDFMADKYDEDDDELMMMMVN